MEDNNNDNICCENIGKAAQKGHKDCLLKYINTTNYDINQSAGFGTTALHYACERSDDEMVEVLLKSKAMVDVKNTTGQTPLSVAAKVSAKCTKLLLLAKANPNSYDSSGQAIIHSTALLSRVNCMKELIDSGCDVNLIAHGGIYATKTALHLSASRDASTTKLLLEGKADANVMDKDGCTPLHESASKNKPECAKVLIQHSAQLNRLYKTKTALHIGAQENNLEILQVLLKAGSNPYILDNKNSTPLHYINDSKTRSSLAELTISHPNCENGPLMQPDNSSKTCMVCNKMFSSFNRRHHCRKCGLLVCNPCSSNKVILFDSNVKERVCKPCYGVLKQGLANSVLIVKN